MLNVILIGGLDLRLEILKRQWDGIVTKIFIMIVMIDLFWVSCFRI